MAEPSNTGFSRVDVALLQRAAVRSLGTKTREPWGRYLEQGAALC
jgi:hypothetical protein